MDLSNGRLPLITITIVPLAMSFYELSRNGPADLVGIFTQSINHKGKQRKGKRSEWEGPLPSSTNLMENNNNAIDEGE